MMKGILLLAAAALLGGCATTPPTNAVAAPADRVFAFQAPADAVAIVVRDEGFVASGCGVGVTVDGTRAAFLAAGEKVTLHVTAGDHILGLVPSDRGLCGAGSEGLARTLPFHVAKGESPHFRIAITGNGIPSLAQTAF